MLICEGGIVLFSIILTIFIFEYFRYYRQEFANIDKNVLANLNSLCWCSSEEYEAAVRENSTSSTIFVIPTNVGNGLRIKVINEDEFSALMRRAKPSKGRTISTTEQVEYVHYTSKEDGEENLHYFFGQEHKDLNHPHSRIGVMVSCWATCQFKESLKFSYEAVCRAIASFGRGYGDRNRAKCLGMNRYSQKQGRLSQRPHPTPFIADDEIGKHEYFNANNVNQLSQPVWERMLQGLLREAMQFANATDPYVMDVTRDYCDKGIFTSGNHTTEYGNKLSEEGLTILWQGSQQPTFGFIVETHVDKNDKPTGKQFRKMKQEASEQGKNYLLRVMDRMQAFCLPTTCGYQYTFNSEEWKKELEVIAYFALDGLGLAVELEDGMFHHFFGAVFSHRTILPLCRKRSTGDVSSSNFEDAFLLLAWGASGGSPNIAAAEEAAEEDAQAAVAAPVAVAAEFYIFDTPDGKQRAIVGGTGVDDFD